MIFSFPKNRRRALCLACGLALSGAAQEAAADLSVPAWHSADGRFSIKARGRVYLDAAFIDGRVGTENTSDAEFRQGRIGVEGVAFGGINYKLEANFAGGSTTLSGATIEFSPLEGVTVIVGQLKPPVSLEEQSSSRFISLMERGSFTDAFGFRRRIGALLRNSGPRYSASVGYFGGDPNTSNTPEGHVIAGRLTGALPMPGGALLHLGLSVRHRTIDPARTALRYRQRPHSHLARNQFVDSGAMAAKGDDFAGLEAAYMAGPWALQGEYGVIRSRRLAAAGLGKARNTTFSGGYLSLSRFITGERRAWRAASGNFGRTRVLAPLGSGGMGALQLVARFDTIDLSDRDIRGGRQRSAIGGINWLLTGHTRLMANVAHAIIRRGPSGNNRVNALSFRLQTDW